MSTETSSLLDREKFSLASFPGYSTSDSLNSMQNGPHPNEAVVNLTSERDERDANRRPGSTFETSLLANDPASLLIALENAADYIRGQAEVSDNHRPRNRKPLLPSWLTNHLLLITFLIQVVGVGILEIFHAIKDLNFNESSPNTSETDVIIVYTGTAFWGILELVHLAVVVLVSFKLAKQVIHHTASGAFLAQCYLSTVLMFAGLYTLEFRFQETSWKNTNLTSEDHPVLVYLRMLYFSVSTATLCGTSAVEPVIWYAFLTSGFQMLLSFVYFASILSISIIPKKSLKKRSREKSFTKSIRKLCGGICNYWKE